MSNRYIKGPEAKLSAEILKALDQLGIPYMRLNSGNKSYKVRGQKKGTPDIQARPQIPHYCTKQFCLWTPVFLWIEVKKIGGIISCEQLEFADHARNRGEYVLFVTTLGEVLNFLKEKNAR